MCEQSNLRRDRMDIHKNARLTPRRREDLVQHVFQGATPSGHIVFRREGPPGLLDRSSRPRRSPRRTSSSLVEEVIALRRLLYPAYRIAQATQLSAATVSAAGSAQPLAPSASCPSDCFLPQRPAKPRHIHSNVPLGAMTFVTQHPEMIEIC